MHARPPRRKGARVIARAVAALVASTATLVWLVPEGAVGTFEALDTARPAQGRDPTPNKLSNPCIPGVAGIRWGSDRSDRTLKDYAQGDVICARKGNDIVTVRYVGTKVWAGPGNDTVRMRNTLPNELQAGTGRDKARADRATTDRWYRDLETYSTAGTEGQHATNAWKYPAREPRIQCVIEEGQRRLKFDPPPRMRAVDHTGQVDWQFVAWSPVLTWWDGSKWQFVDQNEWLWDRTYDESVSVFKGNVWRRYMSGEEWELWFYANRPGFFRVAAYYYHYPTGAVPVNRIYDWVDQHRGPHAASHGRWCHFAS